MSNWLLPILFIALLILLLSLTWISPQSRAKLLESLFRNVGMPRRNLIGFLLGAIASLLLLTSGMQSVLWVIWSFVFSLGVLMFLLVIVRPIERELNRFAWGLLVIILLGFGSGALIYQARSWWIWLWNQYRRINEAHELVLEFLFLLGVILGIFVVRNWGKEQETFIKSLSGLLGGTFIAGVFGEMLKGQGLTTTGALTYYGLGFVMSASINLLVAALLTANYTNRRSISSRSVLDFLYGSERAKIIDEYFLKNFKDDPDYAKARIIDTLIEYQKLVARELADRIEKRRKNRERRRKTFIKREGQAESAAQKTIENEMKELETQRCHLKEECQAVNTTGDRWTEINNKLQEIEKRDSELKKLKEAIKIGGPILEILENRYKQLEPCSQLKAVHDEQERLLSEKEYLSSLSERSRKQQLKLEQIGRRLAVLQQRILDLGPKCSDTRYDEWLNLQRLLSPLKPSYFYWLMAIECEEGEEDETTEEAETITEDRLYRVLYREIASDEGSVKPPDSAISDSAKGCSEIGRDEATVSPATSALSPTAKKGETITGEMFRVGVAIRWRDNLEYIVAPGKYGASFPVFNSVAGLALIFEQIIIMDRDRYRRFRNNNYIEGVCPQGIEQDRGLDEIDYLSYISIPVINRSASERGVGIVNIDTRLFATFSPLKVNQYQRVTEFSVLAFRLEI